MKRENPESYMQNLKKWLAETSGQELEEMSTFFSARKSDYEKHMKKTWAEDYRRFSEELPPECLHILDLGCGTGLELDELWRRNPSLAVTGVDLCQDMLDRLIQKHADKPLTTICMDYFQYNFGTEKWDAVISFESLHHFMPEKKKILYQKIYRSLKNDAVFLLGDYTACCEEEEMLLHQTYAQKRKAQKIPEDLFVHFDIPLTIEHEIQLLKEAGFLSITIADGMEAASLIIASKKGDPSVN